MLKKSLLFMLLMALLMPEAANAQETLTVCNGGNTNSNVPIYSLYADYGTRSQFIYPAALLKDMAGGTIQNTTFYNGTASINFDQGFTVYMMEVDYTTFASTTLVDWSSMTQVYQGSLTVSSNGMMSIELQNPYTYGGENLMIGIQITSWGNTCPSTNWQGENQTGRTALYNNANSSHVWSNTVNGVTFLPKTTFSYEPGQSGGDVCEKPATLVAENVTGNSASLTWTGGSGVYNIELNGTIIEENYEGYTYDLRDLDATTSYIVRVQSVCDGSTPTSGWKNVSFTTPCATYDIPYTYDFEDAAPFDCWTPITGVTRASSTSNAHNSSYYLRFAGTTSNLVALPQFNESTNNLRVEFWTRPENATNSSCGTFSVGYMTDITDASTFVEVANYAYNDWSTATYEKKTVDFVNAPANANIAFRHNAGSSSWYWYADDVTVKEMPSCLAPTGLAANNITTELAELSWTANSGETAWTLFWKKTSDENYTEVANATNPYTLQGLDAATSYQYYVVANCSADEASEASEVFTFVTECDVIPALGYSENFDDYSVASNHTAPSERVLPTCWNAINTTTYSTYKVFPTIYYYSSTNYANSTPNSLKFYSYAYYSSGTTTYDPQPQYAILPEMTGLAGKQVTLMARGYNNTSTFKIGTMTDPTDASTFVAITEQALTTSYQEFEYVIPANASGNYLAIMIDAATSSRTSNGAYIDDISIDNAPTCLKPSSPMLETPSSRTAHTATLSWTNGEEGQSAWQIAYSTSATFAPAADFTPGEGEGLVDADANPYILNGLQANTTYYAYVRANCGAEDGMSAWSRTKATFSTTVANAAPTGLAVDASSITSESATVNWTGVATNDYHDSYEVYYSRLNTLPDPLEIDSLITGITATSYTFNHLDAEKTYYVWVRDNCGNDGLSAWSSRASFTTASSCQTPDVLAESNVTTNSATITWNTYGLTEFNLRYGTDGENWNTIERVNTPYTLDHLTASTTYQVQVQATCADAETWSTVLSFTTACGAITDLPWSENFDAYTGSTSYSALPGYPNDEMPTCWQFLNRSNSTSAYPQVFISSYSGYPVSGKCLFFKSSSSTPLYAILPAFEEEIAGLQLTFTYRNEGTNNSNGTLIVGYMTDPADANTFTTVLTCERTTTLTEMEVLFANAPAGSYIVFKYQGGSSNNFYLSIDNVSVNYIPTCAKPTDLVATPNALSATLTWESEAGAYEVAYATDATATPDENIAGTATAETYTMNELALGDHYFWVRANCGTDGYSEWVGPVSVHIGYCEPAPTSVDGNGISNVTFGMGDNVVNNDTPKATYADYSSQIGAVQAGVESTIAITYATGSSTVYSYGTIIWVDFDNSLSFEENEIIYTGTSTQGNGGTPQLLEANITIPATVTPGDYMMRIGGADDAFDDYISGSSTTAAPDPCYTGSYACFQDYTLRVLENCTAAQTIELEITGYGAGINDEGKSCGWNLIASPLAGETNPIDVEHLINTNLPVFDLFLFDQSAENEWVNWKNDGNLNGFNLEPGKGYLYANQSNVTLAFTGVPVSGTSYEVTLENVSGKPLAGWNLVGNSFNQTAYIQDGRSFYTLNEDRSELITEPISRGIKKMEGVFVKTEAENGETITFTTEAPDEGSGLALNLSRNSKVVDRAIVRFDEARNLPKFQLFENSTKLYIEQDNKDFAVVSAEAQGEMPVSFKAEKNGTYTLSFNTENVEMNYLHLIDNRTGNDVDLLTTPNYSFEAKTTDYACRFRLVFSANSISDNQFAFISNGEIVLNGQGTAQVFDVTGRMISTHHNATRIATENMAAGVYMIRLINGENVKTQKIVIK